MDNQVYLHQDGDRSVFAATDGTGALAAYSYSAFGEPHTYGNPNAAANRYLFQGQLYDRWSNGYSMRAREYYPRLARFASRDPIGFAGGTPNFYAFVDGNPLSFHDPLGLRPQLHKRLRIWLKGIWDNATSVKHLQTATNFVCGVGDACLGALGVDGKRVRSTYGISEGVETNTMSYGAGLVTGEVGLAISGELIDGEHLYEEVSGDHGDNAKSGASDGISGGGSGGDGGSSQGGGGSDANMSLPDDALVCRGGECTAERFAGGKGVTLDENGKLQGVSVTSGAGASVEDLTEGTPHPQVGVTTVGDVRAAGGDVIPDNPTNPRNPYHCTLCSITPQQAEDLFRPTQRNPHK